MTYWFFCLYDWNSDLLVCEFTELATVTGWSLGLHNCQKQPSGLWVYRTGNRGLPVFGFTQLAKATFWSLGLQNWQQRFASLWVYTTGKSNLLVFWFTELATEACQSLGLPNRKHWLAGLWIYNSNLFSYLSLSLQNFQTGLSLQKWLKQFLVFNCLSLQNCQKQLTGLWVYRTGDSALWGHPCTLSCAVHTHPHPFLSTHNVAINIFIRQHMIISITTNSNSHLST